MRIDVLTIFPSCFEGILEVGMVRRARQAQLLKVNLVDLRDSPKIAIERWMIGPTVEEKGWS